MCVWTRSSRQWKGKLFVCLLFFIRFFFSFFSIDMALWITHKKNNLALCHNLFFYIETHTTRLSLSLSALLKRRVYGIYIQILFFFWLPPDDRLDGINTKMAVYKKEWRKQSKKNNFFFLFGDWWEISNRLREMCGSLCIYTHSTGWFVALAQLWPFIASLEAVPFVFFFKKKPQIVFFFFFFWCFLCHI